MPTPSDSSGVQVIPSGLDVPQADSGSGDVGKTVSDGGPISSSSSSSSDSGPVDDVADRCMPKSPFHEQLKKIFNRRVTAIVTSIAVLASCICNPRAPRQTRFCVEEPSQMITDHLLEP